MSCYLFYFYRDEEGEGIFAYAGQPHNDATEVAALSRGVVSIPIDSTTGRSVPEGDGRGNKCTKDSKGQEDEFSVLSPSEKLKPSSNRRQLLRPHSETSTLLLR